MGTRISTIARRAAAGSALLAVSFAADATVVLTHFGLTGADSRIFDFYTAEPGVTSNFLGQGSAITAAALTGVDLFVGVVPTDAYSASEVAALGSFITGGGKALLLGEHSGVSDNTFLNGLLAGIGSSMSISTDQFDCVGFKQATGAQIQGPLMAGVGTFQWSCASEVVGGSVVQFALDGTTPVMATETLGAGRLTVAGDSSSAAANINLLPDNPIFYRNLLTFGGGPTVTPVPEPASVLLVLAGCAAVVGGRRRRARRGAS